TPEERERVGRMYAPARNDVERGLGRLVSPPPLAIFCKSKACSEYFGGTSGRSATLVPGRRMPGATYVPGPRLTVLILRVDDVARSYLAHEMAHAEVGAWVRRFGAPRLVELLRKVRDGASFADVYGPMQTQGPSEVPTVLV